MKSKTNKFIVALTALLFLTTTIWAQTTAFSYQGKLIDAGSPANGAFQMQFKLFDALAGGTQIGSTISDVAVTANQGVFSTGLDFGANALSGENRFLEIEVRRNSGEAYTTLSPREQINSSPYSVRTLSAQQADVALDSQRLGGLNASEYVTTTSVGNTFIRNAATQQTSANFNIDGNGAVGGNLGIGTETPQTKLEVRGNLTLDSGASPVLYTSTAGAEENRYLQLVNSFASPSASGLKAGGILVADSFSFFNPGKNNLVVKGNVGIGAGVVDSSGKLTISGQNAIDISGFNPFITMADTGEAATISPTLQRIQAVGGALVFHRRPPCNSLPCPPFSTPPMIIDPNGRIGIGTPSPVSTLDVRGRLTIDGSGGNPVVLFTGTGGVEQNRYLELFNSPSFPSASGLKAGGILVADDYNFAQPGKNDLIVKGTARTGVLQITGGSDLAENFQFVEEVKPGMVVSIDSQNAGKLTISRRAYNRGVAGIISGANNLSAGMILPDLKKTENSMPVALSGRVWVYCDATKNPIKPGDLLTSSATPGHAMKVANYKKAQGAVIGKAMTELKSGKGLVLVLVTLQ